ncbi:MAG: hypothetical protein KJ017_12935 [Alphaproteobacteria bacterium]|nr:hypothetical protein [Alphaproteobacteria bacterium]
MVINDPGEQIRQSLSDPAVRRGVVEAYARTFRSAGVAQGQTLALAEQVIGILERAPTEQAQAEIYELFARTPAKTRFTAQTTLNETFPSFLSLRAKAFSSQVMFILQDLPEESLIANVSPHHDPLSQRVPKFKIVEVEDAQGLRGPFQVAVLNNVLHHEAPEEAQALLDAVKESDVERLIVIENATLGRNAAEIERDRAVQYVHEYLFHRLLQGPRGAATPLPGNYDTADGWRAKLEQMGWRQSQRDSFIMEPHHTVMVFEREP